MEEFELESNLKKFIVTVGEPVNSAELVDAYSKFRDVENTGQKFKIILTAWEVQQKEERNLRRKFALAILIVLLVQIMAINVAFFLIGFKKMEVEKWVATTFIIAVFSEIVSMTLIVLRYLFPKASKELMELVQKL